MFVNRDKELKILEDEYKTEGFRFCVLSGRRMVGKTTLIREFIKDKDAVYLLAALENENILIQKFKDYIADFFNDDFLREININSFEQVFKYIANKKYKKKLVIVIDEFQYLAKVNSAISSIFQNIVDNFFKDKNILLILCGSIISLMYKETLSYGSALYGRRTSNIKLSSLKFEYIKEFFPNKNNKELIEIYSILYGIPKYLEIFKNEKDIFKSIEKNILDKDSFLYNEPYFLLQDEISETLNYFSILEVIASGEHKIGNIAAKLQKKVNDITFFIKKLIDLDILYKDIPVTEKNISKSKKGLYFIRDNFLRFWFRYVFAYKSQLEIGNTEFVLKKIKESFNEYVSKTFEDLAIEYTLKNFNLLKCGRWWDKNIEIDLVGFGEGFIIFGECKWQNKKIGIKVYEELVKKSNAIKTDLDKKYIIFSKNGFTDDLKNLYEKNEDLFLIDTDDF